MKPKPLPLRPLAQDNLIANFGGARLMRKFNGACYLIGGNDADRADAKEWVSMFMHEASISFPRRRRSAPKKGPKVLKHGFAQPICSKRELVTR